MSDDLRCPRPGHDEDVVESDVPERFREALLLRRWAAGTSLDPDRREAA